jgi:quercetin dioxygenase-like cupin family protein
MVEFLKGESMGDRSWGEEVLLCTVPGAYTFKVLTIKAGKKGGLQYHRFKDEAGYLVSGRLKVRFVGANGELTEKILEAGSAFRFRPNEIHQEEALTDCKVIEVSTPYINDRVRVEELFDLDGAGYGLPSTHVSDVVFLDGE